jgi:hypothetical protein
MVSPAQGSCFVAGTQSSSTLPTASVRAPSWSAVYTGATVSILAPFA